MMFKYFGSYADITNLPRSDCEIAFIGRSNVGKSSTINSIAGQKICFVSKKPGKTVTINFFGDEKNRFYLVDLPGYGFAKVNNALHEKWNILIPEYLSTRSQLKAIFLLIDSRIGFMDSDIDAINIISKFNKKISIIFTKIDKIHQNDLDNLKKSYDSIVAEFSSIYYISNKNKKNRDIEKIKSNIHKIFTN